MLNKARCPVCGLSSPTLAYDGRCPSASRDHLAARRRAIEQGAIPIWRVLEVDQINLELIGSPRHSWRDRRRLAAQASNGRPLTTEPRHGAGARLG